MIDRAKRNFINYPHDSIPQGWKDILKNLQVFISINPKFKRTCASAAFMEFKPAIKYFQIPKTFQPVTVDKKLGFLIIEINPKTVILNSCKEVFDTVSHELAHCLDFVLRGYEGKSDKHVHGEFWQFLHKRMGGSGRKYGTTSKNKQLLKLISKRVKKVKTNFLTSSGSA
jgi:hypothetical protein